MFVISVEDSNLQFYAKCSSLILKSLIPLHTYYEHYEQFIAYNHPYKILLKTDEVYNKKFRKISFLYKLL